MKPPIERLLTDSPVLIFLCHEILPKTYVKSSHLMKEFLQKIYDISDYQK